VTHLLAPPSSSRCTIWQVSLIPVIARWRIAVRRIRLAILDEPGRLYCATRVSSPCDVPDGLKVPTGSLGQARWFNGSTDRSFVEILTDPFGIRVFAARVYRGP
jgi:hypothetical protein